MIKNQVQALKLKGLHCLKDIEEDLIMKLELDKWEIERRSELVAKNAVTLSNVQSAILELEKGETNVS
jgi:hypothetical protein